LKKVKRGPLTSANIRQMKGAKVRVEKKNHSHSRRRRIRYTSTTVLLKWQSQHFILTTSLSPDLLPFFFWKAKL